MHFSAAVASNKPCIVSEFIWDFGKLPFPSHLGKYFNKIGKISAKIHEIGKIKAIFGLGMTPIYGLKNGQIKSLIVMLTYNKTCVKRPLSKRDQLSLNALSYLLSLRSLFCLFLSGRFTQVLLYTSSMHCHPVTLTYSSHSSDFDTGQV